MAPYALTPEAGGGGVGAAGGSALARLITGGRGGSTTSATCRVLGGSSFGFKRSGAIVKRSPGCAGKMASP